MRRPRPNDTSGWYMLLKKSGLGVIKGKQVIVKKQDDLYLCASRLQDEACQRGEDLPRRKALRQARKIIAGERVGPQAMHMKRQPGSKLVATATQRSGSVIARNKTTDRAPRSDVMERLGKTGTAGQIHTGRVSVEPEPCPSPSGGDDVLDGKANPG